MNGILQILQKVAELLLNFDQTFSGCSQNAALLRLILKIAGKRYGESSKVKRSSKAQAKKRCLKVQKKVKNLSSTRILT